MLKIENVFLDHGLKMEIDFEKFTLPIAIVSGENKWIILKMEGKTCVLSGGTPPWEKNSPEKNVSEE